MPAIKPETEPSHAPPDAAVGRDGTPASNTSAWYEVPRGVVLVHAPDSQAFAQVHELTTRSAIAVKLAALKGYAFGGQHEPQRHYSGPVYLVPGGTLVGLEAARSLGVSCEHDLFGGVVPHAFVATKVITHPLVDPRAPSPAGWAHGFQNRVRGAVLTGFAVFTREDALAAAQPLLARGPLRLKPACATGGRGQFVIVDDDGLDAALRSIDAAELARDGLVLEENLVDVTTHSVGQVRVAELVASYHGTQRLTSDNHGEQVYGGSDLLVVRGGFDALVGLDLTPEARLAVTQAQTYDAAVMAEFPGFFASRRNYDIAQGSDAQGRRRSGVLEQSWRLGGASGAEIAALEAFRADPKLQSVRAATVELYGEGHPPPPRAVVYFQGIDPTVGPMIKFAMLKPDADAR